MRECLESLGVIQFKMLPNWLKKALKYFRWWGFHVIPFENFGGNIKNWLILIFHIGLCTWCSFSAFNQFSRKQAFMEFIDALNFFLYYITSASLYWTILYDSYTTRNEQQMFWKIYARANERLRSELNLTKGNYFLIFSLLLAADLTACIMAIVREVKTDPGRIMHLTFLCVVDHRIFFYLLHLKVISYELNKIKHEIKEMSENISNVPVNYRFRFFREQFDLVFGMTEHVNRIFGLSHLVLIMLGVHSSVTFSNFTYRLFQRKFNKYQYGVLFCRYTNRALYFKMGYFQIC